MDTLPFPSPTLSRCGEAGEGHHAAALTCHHHGEHISERELLKPQFTIGREGVAERGSGREGEEGLVKIVIDFEDAEIRRGTQARIRLAYPW